MSAGSTAPAGPLSQFLADSFAGVPEHAAWERYHAAVAAMDAARTDAERGRVRTFIDERLVELGLFPSHANGSASA